MLFFLMTSQGQSCLHLLISVFRPAALSSSLTSPKQKKKKNTKFSSGGLFYLFDVSMVIHKRQARALVQFVFLLTLKLYWWRRTVSCDGMTNWDKQIPVGFTTHSGSTARRGGRGRVLLLRRFRADRDQQGGNKFTAQIISTDYL